MLLMESIKISSGKRNPGALFAKAAWKTVCKGHEASNTSEVKAKSYSSPTIWSATVTIRTKYLQFLGNLHQPSKAAAVGERKTRYCPLDVYMAHCGRLEG